MSNLADFLYRSAAVYPGKSAIIFEGWTVTYRELSDCGLRIAKGLVESGIKPGDRVALSCPNITQFIMAYYGILSSGAVVVPLNIMLKSDEIAYLLQDSQSKAFICFEGTDELPLGQSGLEAFQQVDSCQTFIAITKNSKGEAWHEQLTMSSLLKHEPQEFACEREAEDTAAILYTSGTTGKPKGAELTHHNLAMNTLSCSLIMKTDVADTHLVALPLFHSFAQTVHMLNAVACASTMVLMARFDPEQALKLLTQKQITVSAGVPTLYIALNGIARTLPDNDRQTIAEQLRLSISGGGPMPVEVLKAFETNFNVSVLEGYGLSETSPAACFNTLDQERIPGSIGRPLPGVTLRVVDENDCEVADGQKGELIIHGHNVMKGYLVKIQKS